MALVTALTPNYTHDNRLSVGHLCVRYKVDMAHARCVAGIAVELFDRTRYVHHLDRALRPTVYYAGLLHDVAHSQGRKKHHKRGRDIILTTPVRELTETQRRLIAVSTAFHRKKWKKKRLKKEFSYTELDDDLQPFALWVAAIVRIADGLDHSRTQSSIVQNVKVNDKGATRITVVGALQKKDVKKAHKKADLWRKISDLPMSVKTGDGP